MYLEDFESTESKNYNSFVELALVFEIMGPPQIMIFTPLYCEILSI